MQQTQNQGFQLPPGAVPLSLIFAVREGENEKIGIIINEHAPHEALLNALSNAVKVVQERMQNAPVQQTGSPQQPRHPKLTEILME